MKKISLIILVVGCLGLVGCGDDKKSSSGGEVRISSHSHGVTMSQGRGGSDCGMGYAHAFSSKKNGSKYGTPSEESYYWDSSDRGYGSKSNSDVGHYTLRVDSTSGVGVYTNAGNGHTITCVPKKPNQTSYEDQYKL